MTCGIYKIEYKQSVAYIGSSINLERRWKQHIRAMRNGKHHNFLLQRVFDKHGINVFSFSVLESCTDTELENREQYYIDSLKPLFNLSDASGRHLHTEEAKKKMRGRFVSEETRKKLSDSHKGKPNGRKGIKTGFIPKSAFKKGQIPWNKGKKLKSSWNKGKHLSEEAKKKMSDSHKNKLPTKAQIEYWESMKGKRRKNNE